MQNISHTTTEQTLFRVTPATQPEAYALGTATISLTKCDHDSQCCLYYAKKKKKKKDMWFPQSSLMATLFVL